jgi:hypothetical protein
MKLSRSLLRRLTGWLLLVSFICASAGALIAIRMDRPEVGVRLLIAAACGLGLAIIMTFVKPFLKAEKERRFHPRGR